MMLTTANAQTAGDAPIRVGIAGLAHGHVDGFFQRSLHRPEIQLVGIAEADQALAARYSSQYDLKQIPMYTSLEDMLEKAHPQAVLVYTNTYDHRKVVEACARHGVHVMMEKPMAVSAEDAHAMADAARKGKIQVMVNYETSWYRSNHAAYDMVHEGAIGDIRKVVVHDGHQGPKEINVQPEFFAWLNDPKLNGAGALYDFGCYGADLMTWLMDGQRPTSITAVTRHIKPEIYHVDDDATIILTYPKAQAILQPSWNWPFDRKDMEVYGQTGYVITVRHDDVRVRLKGDEQDKLVAAKPVPPPSTDSITLLKAVVGGAAPDAPSSLETNLIVAEILDAARRSAATGKTVLMSPDGSTH
jgi:predicted dehydrogenase